MNPDMPTPVPDVYRVYYHKRENAPQVWSVDSGDSSSEIHVQGFELSNTVVESCTAPEAKHGEPAGWLQVFGVLTIRDGWAFIDGK